jgi:hypothetical protein
MNIYVKSVPADATAAIKVLEEQICTQYAPSRCCELMITNRFSLAEGCVSG